MNGGSEEPDFQQQKSAQFEPEVQTIDDEDEEEDEEVVDEEEYNSEEEEEDQAGLYIM